MLSVTRAFGFRCFLFMLLTTPQLVKSSESQESVDIRLKIDNAFNEISTMLSFVTFMNVFYGLCFLYAVVFVCYALIYVRNHNSEKSFEKSMEKSKDLTLQTVKVERY